MESLADKSTSNTPTTPQGSSQGVKDSNEPPLTNSTTQGETNPGDTFDDGEKPGDKRKRSVAWNHFKKMKVNGEDKAECDYCQKRLGGSSKNGTKHLLDHFERCPRRKFRDIRKSILVKEQKKSDGSSSYLSNYTFNPDKSRRELAEMIILHEYPLTMVEQHGFRKFVGGIQPLFKVPCRNTIKSDILKIYDFERLKTKKLLGRNTSRVAITMDMWTASHQRKGFMAVTAHFIDEFWNLQSRIMSFSLREWTKSSIDEVSLMAYKMMSKFDKYWSVIHGIMGMAAILDPRYKLKFVELLMPALYGPEKAKDEFKSLEEFVRTFFKEYESTKTRARSCNEGGASGLSSFSSGLSSGYSGGFKKFLSDIEVMASENDDSGNMVELDNYLKEKLLPKDVDLDLLIWWRANGSKYPTLQRMAKDILAIPVSTVASESAFSTSGRLISPHRSRLHPKTLEALMCAQSWLLNEIRETCSEESDAYCLSVEYDEDVEESGNKESGTTTLDDLL